MANGAPMTIEQILSAHKTARDRLAAMSKVAGDRLDEVRRRAPVTSADEAEIAQLRQQQRDISSDLADLARLTAEMLEDSAELGEMITSLKKIIAGLNAKKEQLRRLESAAGTVADVVAGLETVAQEAAKRLAS